MDPRLLSVYLLVGTVGLLPAAGPPRLGGSATLPAAVRARLDALATRQPLTTFAQESVDRVGTVPAWILSRIDLSPALERKLSDQWHATLVRRETVVPAPVAVQRVLDRLVSHLPAHLKPAEFRYTLEVVDRTEIAAFSSGGGRVYITRPLLRAALDCQRGEAVLAYLLARELGHIGLGHCRRGWLNLRLQEDLNRGVQNRFAPGTLREILETGIHGSGELLLFLYSRNQEDEADLLALHLCRNVGYPIDHAIDGLRLICALFHPRAAIDPTYRPEGDRPPSTLEYFLSSAPAPLVRLRRLLMERDGIVIGKEFGLYRYERRTGRLERCRPGTIAADARPVLFVHGLRGDLGSFRAYLETFTKDRRMDGRPLLVFRYPGNASLIRCGRFLHQQIKAILPTPGHAAFVCHSAGGLIFRYYAECEKGGFDRAVLLATPHAGSSLTDLKFLLDVFEFAGDLSGGLVHALAQSIPEGRGEIIFDLHSDSLFLRWLGRNRPLAARYHIFYGQYLSFWRALLLRQSVGIARRALIRGSGRFGPGLVGTAVRGLLDRLRVPPEVLEGDLVVRPSSARLPGAGRETRTALQHLAFRTDPEIIRQVLESLLSDPAAARP